MPPATVISAMAYCKVIACWFQVQNMHHEQVLQRAGDRPPENPGMLGVAGDNGCEGAGTGVGFAGGAGAGVG